MADLYHALTWPQLSYVAEDPSSGKIVGYILAKMCVPRSIRPASNLPGLILTRILATGTRRRRQMTRTATLRQSLSSERTAGSGSPTS